MMQAASDQALVIAGPTAVGKSEVAHKLALLVGGEIISVDSMQVYRDMDIGTAKPPVTARAEVRYHLLDIIDLQDSFDAGTFCDRARVAQRDILSRGKIPIYCGGTGLYYRALVEGLGEVPGADRNLRAQLYALPHDLLLNELQRNDPATFQVIDRQNRRRVVRAIEVIRLTGRPFSEARAAWSRSGTPAPWVSFGLERSKDELIRRIDQRVEAMFARGLVEEVRRLLEKGLRENPIAMQALGYRQVVAHLDGELSLAATIELVKVKTRQYAKKQRTWFKRQMLLEWVLLQEGAAPDEQAKDLRRRFIERIAERGALPEK